MIFLQSCYRMLVVSSSDAFNKSIGVYLKNYNFLNVTVTKNVNSAKKTFLEEAFDLVIINSPLTDDFGSRFAVDITVNSGCVVLFLTKSESFVDIFDKVYKSGVYVMAKPVNKAMLDIAFEWMLTTRERLRKNEKNQYSLEEKMKEIRTVNKAKWILIEQLKMSESDAHRYIEKQSMDMCKPKIEVAETIIKTYK